MPAQYDEEIRKKINVELEKIRVNFIEKEKVLVEYGENKCLLEYYMDGEIPNEYYLKDSAVYEKMVKHIEITIILEGLGLDVNLHTNLWVRNIIAEKVDNEYKKSKEYKLKNMYK
jgi:hypothetical protein